MVRAPAYREDGGSIPPPPVRSFGSFVHPNLPVSFGIDSKSCWSLLTWCRCQGSKKSHAGKWKRPVTASVTLDKDTLK